MIALMVMFLGLLFIPTAIYYLVERKKWEKKDHSPDEKNRIL